MLKGSGIMPAEKKQAAKVALLLVVIAAAVGFTYWRLAPKKPKPTEAIMGQKIERIDRETLELITLRLDEWLKLGHRNGIFKNPHTGKYTMVMPIICRSCGEKIPAPVYTPELEELKKTDPEAALAAFERLEAEYVCPKCGKNAGAGIHD